LKRDGIDACRREGEGGDARLLPRQSHEQAAPYSPKLRWSSACFTPFRFQAERFPKCKSPPHQPITRVHSILFFKAFRFSSPNP
jgi:hypothetical protein